MRKRDFAAIRVKLNWRIRKRLPRITKLAIEMGMEDVRCDVRGS